MFESLTQNDANGQPGSNEPLRTTAADAAPNPFDPARLRLGQDFASTIGVKKVLTVIPCRKPGRQEFIRVRPGAEWRLETGCFEDKINGDIYLVDRSLWPDLASEVFPVCLFLAITRQGNVFLWPCKLPGVEGRTNTWNESALAAAQHAEGRWVRVSSNIPAGAYDVVEAADELSAPAWPEVPFAEILRLCFGGRIIQGLDHPVLRALRGEL